MAVRDHNRIWRRQRVSSATDALLFFFVFAGGVTGIFWLKYAGYSQITVTALPCISLVFYAAMISLVPYFRLRGDQAGDNCYYLGFLYTLVSLSLALATFVRAGGTEKIVEDFGIALASTIVGLMLRVAFNQMRHDPVDVEREARLELASAAQRLRSELDQIVIDMNVFRRATQQSVAEGLEEINAKVNELLSRNLERYDEVTRSSAERIDQTLASFTENARRLNDVAEKNVTAIALLTERIEAIKAPEDLVETKLKPFAETVAQMAEDLKQRAGAESREFRQLRKMIDGALATASGLEGHVNQIAGALDSLVKLHSSLDTAEQRLAALSAGLDGVGASLATGAGQWREVLTAELDGVRTSLKDTNSAIVETSAEFRRSLLKPAAEVGKVLEGLAAQGESLASIEGRLRRLTEALEEQTGALTRLREEAANNRSWRDFRWPRSS